MPGQTPAAVELLPRRRHSRGLNRLPAGGTRLRDSRNRRGPRSTRHFRRDVHVF